MMRDSLLYNPDMSIFPGRKAMQLRRLIFLIIGMVFSLVFLAACGQQPPASSTPTPVPTQAPTIPVPSQLTICLGQEPASLFPLDNPSSAARSVLAAVYDGPIDSNVYQYQAVILERLPSIENGDAQLFAQEVHVGDEVVDASDTPVTLGLGMKIRPAGCASEACAITYDGSSTIKMDQMQVTFNILPGITWSDGQPLSADDSVYAYQVAVDSASTGSRYLVDRTKSYEAADASTVQWWGKPGFVDPTYFTNFWSPLPQHAWSQIPVEELSSAEESSRKPLGWGAFTIQEWVEGSSITLVRNTRYFRSEQGLPRLDILTYRFVTDANTAISDLLAGKCDILDPSLRLDGQAGLLRTMAEQNQAQAMFTSVPVMEGLALGIQGSAGGSSYFEDVRVRQGLAYCLDRQQVVDTVLLGLSSVPASTLPPSHPMYDPKSSAYTFNITAGSQLLEQAGWKDADNDASTPRRAQGIEGIPNGTPFEVSYITTNAIQRQQVSAILAASLAQCGVKVNVEYVDATTLYAAGPDGVLFGRKFELAEFAMGSTGIETPCDWYTSAQIPEAANAWVGTNLSGYSNPAFDAACQATRNSLPGDPAHSAAYAQVQSIFASELPIIPLYWRVQSAAARPEVCGFTLDPTASSSLWNIEAIGRGSGCTP
jgi:peptide/nickel transport system substrate-binding protein